MASIKNIERLVAGAKKHRKNRAYYHKYFDIVDPRAAGLVQDHPAKTQLDLVELADANRNELIYLFGFHQTNASCFELTLSVVSLYPGGPACPASKWRLARAQLQLVLVDQDDGRKWTSYSYECEQLLDYEAKRLAADTHEASNIYKLGSLTLETVQPFSLARLLVNGRLLVETFDHSDPSRGPRSTTGHKSMRLSLSIHPTCDKFDYQHQFDVKFTAHTIDRALTKGAGGCEASRLLGLVLEDRFDQPLMFEGRLEDLEAGGTAGGAPVLARPFFMWGARVKKFAQANEQTLRDPPSEERARDHLFAWTECGQQVHLTRPKWQPNLVYGLVHSSYDYASPLMEVSLRDAKRDEGLPLEQVGSFSELAADHVIKVRAFQRKEFTIEFQSIDESLVPPHVPSRPIKINGYQGRALCLSLDFEAQIQRAQERLLVMSIHDSQFACKLAEERLLGGKGNSLVQLARLVHQEKRLARATFAAGAQANVSVPRGLVVTSKAYEVWLASDSDILGALRELDATRRVLAARSALHLDPLDRAHISAAKAQAMLRERCEATRARLLERPLPRKLNRQIRESLLEMFGGAALDDPVGGPEPLRAFAVRSSCVGEDSLETSAAGQMKTLLGVRGFDAISRAIVDCWLSQFKLEALTYKSQNGLAFNLPMAVVVQELVECRVAGVAATCDPLTGNKSRLEITANLGLGEGVVAGRTTDTVRVSLGPGQEILIEKLLPAPSAQCCLSDDQIEALSHLLLELRESDLVEEREVEWGLTVEGNPASLVVKSSRSSSASSSSSSSSTPSSRPAASEDSPSFHIHLLQSRPLTHLQRLSDSEILHELDYGTPCPRDLVSRANLGEVMPGALSPLYLSLLNPIFSSYMMRKPYEENHTRCPYAADNMAFHAQMAHSVITYSDSASRFALEDEREGQKAEAIMYSMIGATFDELDDAERAAFERFCREKVHPLKPEVKLSLGLILAVDVGLFPALRFRAKRQLRRWKLVEGLSSLESLCERTQTGGDPQTIDLLVRQQIEKLCERLICQLKPLTMAWICHMLGTFSSVAFNVIAMKILGQQPANKKVDMSTALTSSQVLNDFTVLMRDTRSPSGGEKQTESGDISRLLSQLLNSFAEDNQLERMRAMSLKELYDFLTDPGNSSKCCHLFRYFMAKNGHRAWKEFCPSTRTWADTPSSIVKLLAARLKWHTPEDVRMEQARCANRKREHQANLKRVLEKIQANRFLLLNCVIPRARNRAIRRESTKSMLIRAIHKYRLAFRHLGGLLCLAGLLPSADLIFQLTIGEIDEVIRKCCSPQTPLAARNNLMPRLLYKARRRQQLARQVDKVTMPRPTLPLVEMFKIMEEQTGENRANGGQHTRPGGQSRPSQEGAQVEGLISCAGCVTGRACVISSLDEADQIEPNDILITYSIDISWSVYFYSLAGIVTEVGGIVSHGAVVAREYGLPTLCTAVGACSKFKTGQLVTLDATRGVCYLAESPKE